jgi:LacI family transcriptional regulator
MKPRKSVALLIETSNSYARGVLEGIVSYIHEHEPWSIYLPEQDRGATPPTWLKKWRGDGLIARIETDEIAKAVRAVKLPVIDVSAARHLQDIPWVETNDKSIAVIASDHLLQRGFKHFAFCGDPEFNWSNWREQHFATAVGSVCSSYQVFQSTPRRSPDFSWEQEKKRLAKWVKSLPKPTGVFACYDIMAQRVLDVCRESNINVPEDLALVGVDNDHLLCSLCTPPLTSVIPNAHQTGREAAQLLDKLMSGANVHCSGYLIDPIGIATRQSTDVLAIDDQDVAAAVRFIREHACEGINVSDVLEAIPLSRRVLESRFQAVMGRTPHEEITRQRIEKVRQLLIETDLSLSKIAERAGFRHEEYMSVAFSRMMKMPPGKYRRSHTMT